MGFWNSVGKWLGAVPVPDARENVRPGLLSVPVERTPVPRRPLIFHALAGREHRGDVQYVKATPGRGQMFMFECVVITDPTVENIRVVAGPDAPPEWEEWYPPIRDGVSRELERVAPTDRVISLRVELIRLRFHDVDTSPAAAAGAGQLLVDQLIRGWPATVPLPPFPAAWRTDAVVGLARAAAEDGRFAALPVLADALEEAGCDDPLALAHLRTCTDHAPRCWVADWVLAAT